VHAHLAPRDLALILAVVTLWGFTFVPTKWALEEIPPFMLAGLRFVLAAVPAVFLVARPTARWSTVAAYGIAIGVLQFGLLFLGIKLGMPAGLASLVAQTQVFFTMGLAVWLAGDKPHRWNILGAIVAAFGVAVLGAYKVIEGAGATLIGFFLIICASLCWGVGNLIAKRAQGVDMFSLVVWSSLVPPPILALVSWFAEGGSSAFAGLAHISWFAWLCVAILAWVGTLFGFSAWNRLLQRYPTQLVSPFALLIPVSGLTFGWLLLGETLAPMQFAGVLLVFAGLAVNVYGSRLWAWARAVRSR
jgi:O-acetylserine/cysteine efflux transporter